MIRNPGVRFWTEAVLSGLTAALTVLTLLSATWIEAVFGVNLDEGNGAIEWALVAAFATVSATLAVLARAQWTKRVDTAR